MADSAYVIGRIWHDLLKNQDGEIDSPDVLPEAKIA
jgi:hypothetical protein